METQAAVLQAAELERRRDELESAMVGLRSEIATAKARVWTVGEYSDPEWFARTQNELLQMGVEHQRTLRALAEVKRQERRQREDGYQRSFISAARRRLSPELFSELMAEAREHGDA